MKTTQSQGSVVRGLWRGLDKTDVMIFFFKGLTLREKATTQVEMSSELRYTCLWSSGQLGGLHRAMEGVLPDRRLSWCLVPYYPAWGGKSGWQRLVSVVKGMMRRLGGESDTGRRQGENQFLPSSQARYVFKSSLAVQQGQAGSSFSLLSLPFLGMAFFHDPSYALPSPCPTSGSATLRPIPRILTLLLEQPS